MALSIRGSVNPQDYFLGGLESIILIKMLPFVDITHNNNYIVYTVWTPILGEAMLQVACGSSNSQN